MAHSHVWGFVQSDFGREVWGFMQSCFGIQVSDVDINPDVQHLDEEFIIIFFVHFNMVFIKFPISKSS